MEPRNWLRGGSVVVALGAVAAMVLHACASTSPAPTATPQVQAATAQQGSSENATSTAPAANAPAVNPPAVVNDGDDEGPYMPATKAGPGIVLSKPKHPKTPVQQQNAAP